MRIFVLLLAMIMLLALFLLSGCRGNSTALLLPDKPYGLCFGAYVDGSSPDLGAVPDAVQVTKLLQVLRPFTNSIYVYSCSTLKNSTESTASIAHKLGFNVTAGCWLSKDKVANEREIGFIIAEIRKGNVDLAVVGSEVLLRQDLTSEEMIGYIRRVKGAGVPVTSADGYHEIILHPEVVAELDKVMVNIYPFWSGSNIATAFDDFLTCYTQVREAYPGKEVIIGETGWPSAGNTIGQAVPTSTNSLAYLQKILDWSNSNSIKCYYFEAYDEPYKVTKEGLLGAHWGLGRKTWC